MADDAWPIVLLVLRISVVVVLYLFLLAGFRALRAELVAPRLQLAPTPRRQFEDTRGDLGIEGEVDEAGGAWVTAASAPAPATADPAADAMAPELPPELDRAAPGTRISRARAKTRRRRAKSRRRIPLALGISASAAALVVVLASAATLTGRTPEAGPPGGVAAAPANEPLRPPAVKPAAGRVTVGLAAQEDSLVRVTVDGVVQFDGTLRARQRQAWDGAQRIQVWTDKGKTVLIAINGEDLGPYSPAMGHADWNRIDFGFIPGWTR